MTVHVDTARHNHQAGGVQRFVRPSRRIRRRRDDPALFDPQVEDFAVDAVARIVDRAIFNAEECHQEFTIIKD